MQVSHDFGAAAEVGEALSRLGGAVPAARHRVRPPRFGVRLSIVAFYHPSLRTPISPVGASGPVETIWNLVAPRVGSP